MDLYIREVPEIPPFSLHRIEQEYIYIYIPGLFAGRDPTRGLGHGVFTMSRVGSGRVGSGQ